jgi:hypothetical protein
LTRRYSIDRVLVFTRRPGRCSKNVAIELSFPASLAIGNTCRILMRRSHLYLIEDDVRAAYREKV